VLVSEHPHHMDHMLEWVLMGLSTGLVIVTIFIARSKFSKYQDSGAENTGLAKVLENKWYVDELYEAIIVKPLMVLSRFFQEGIERSGIDALVNGVGRGVKWGGGRIRLLQNGQVGFYIFAMVIGMIVLFVISLFL